MNWQRAKRRTHATPRPSPHLTRVERESSTPRLANIGYRGSAVMTRVRRMSQRLEPHEYRGFNNEENGGVYIVTSPTHYPAPRLTLVFSCL
jgi:hypothetical protein